MQQFMQPLQYVSQHHCISLCTRQHKMTTIMQPFQCDLQPQIQETHRTTHIDTTTRCRTQEEKPITSGTTPAAPPHTRGTFHRRLQPLYTEKYKKAHATFMQPLQYGSQHHVANLHLSTHMATPDDNNQSCSHSNAICNHRFKKRKELRT